MLLFSVYVLTDINHRTHSFSYSQNIGNFFSNNELDSSIMEYQAVIMAAGRGSRMTDLTHDRPKCLLPICNRPMIWFSFKMLENAGFEGI